jgi:hypothetical protein
MFSTKYDYSYFQNDLIYQLYISRFSSYVSGIYSPLRDLIVDRHNNDTNLSSKMNRVLERDYNSYLSYIDQSSRFPCLYSLTLSLNHANSYFREMSEYYSPQKVSFDNFYPIAVRYTDGRSIWLIERPPFLATVTYKNSRSHYTGKESTYSIWMPWTAMLLQISPETSNYSASLFFNDGPITSLDDKAVPCFFPNMYSNGRMCLNQTSVLLQQHLAQTNSFDPATIYNFIINDYMTGGWNSDLGVQAFDRYAHVSEKARSAKWIIVHGKNDDKKNYPPSTTPSGRMSDKKYIPNFLNYFSKSTLEEITQIVTETKNISSSNYFATYSSYIEELASSVASSHPFSDFLQLNSGTNRIYKKYNLYLDPSVHVPLNNIYSDSPATFFEESMGSHLLNYIKNDLFSHINNLSSDENYTHYSANVPDLYLAFEDNNFSSFSLDPAIHNQDYFSSKFSVSSNQVQTV